MTKALTVILLFAGVGLAQTFDVASVKGSHLSGKESRRQSLQSEPGSLTMRNVTLTNAVAWAYGVQDFRVTGPRWMSDERYDIMAKAAEKADDEHLRPMLQALLAERLKLAVHKEEKVMPYYILTVAKGGPKFKETASEGDPDFHPGANRTSVVATRMTVARFCELIGMILRAPIEDQTGLKGRYDANLDLSALIADYPQGPQPEDIPAIVMNGIQDMLGLKLEAKKGPVELIVVDRAEKVPTEN